MCSPAHAGWSNDPSDPFAGPTVLFESQIPGQPRDMVITWTSVDDPHDMCQRVSGRLYHYTIEACAVPVPTEARCVIIVGRKVDMFTLGHELRHCFQGSWHGEPKITRPK
jgi:hypothetical protein